MSLDELLLIYHSKEEAYLEAIEWYGDMMSPELIEALEGHAQSYGYYVSNPQDIRTTKEDDDSAIT